VLGKKSGVDDVDLLAQRFNINLTKKEAMDVLKKIKKQAHDFKRVITEEEFKKIVER